MNPCIHPGCNAPSVQYRAVCEAHTRPLPARGGIYWPTSLAWELETSETEAAKDLALATGKGSVEVGSLAEVTAVPVSDEVRKAEA